MGVLLQSDAISYNVPVSHSLFTTLKNLRGNARGCVYTEALWGIPFNLYAPYASVYMLAFGLTDAQIGLIASIGLVCQIFWALLSGAITDKLGRRRTTLIADLVSWSVPVFIWAISQNFTYFLVAVIFNSVWRVSMTSWTCLFVEDTNPALLVDVYAWIYIANLVVAFIAPFGGLLIARFTLVPTMRGLYLLAFVMMTAKFFATNAMVTETKQGLIRMQETRDQPLFAVLGESVAVLKQVARTPVVLVATGLLMILSIARLVSNTFWSIMVTERLLIPPEHLAIFYSTRSIIQLLIFFLVMPRLRATAVHRPMAFGFAGLLLSQAILIALPVHNYPLLLLATLVEACSLPVATALLDKLLVLIVDSKERARIMALVYVIVILCTSPFGWIAGRMSGINRTLPFVLNIVLYCLGGLLAFLAGRLAGVVPESTEVD
jgi:MFS family permease